MEPLQTIAPAFLRNLLRSGPLSQEKLECAWVVAVGPAIARVTTVSLLSDGAVQVHANDATWLRELRRALPEISHRLRVLVGPDSVTVVKLDRAGADGPA